MVKTGVSIGGQKEPYGVLKMSSIAVFLECPDLKKKKKLSCELKTDTHSAHTVLSVMLQYKKLSNGPGSATHRLYHLPTGRRSGLSLKLRHEPIQSKPHYDPEDS